MEINSSTGVSVKTSYSRIVTALITPASRGKNVIAPSLQVKEIRKKAGLTQAKFCDLIDVNLETLRNWEQRRREPTGPAKALLRAINNDPMHVLAALTNRMRMDKLMVA